MKSEMTLTVEVPRFWVSEMYLRLKLSQWLMGLACWIAGVGVEYKSTDFDEE